MNHFKNQWGDIELWKDIPGWYGLYRVSTFGRIKSMERIVESNGRQKIVRARYLALAPDKDGYLGVQLSKDGVQTNWRVHRLVATCFLPNPNNYPQVNHIDNDVTNNAVTNLEWCTPLENMQHSAKQGRKVAVNRKIAATDIPIIKEAYQQGSTMEAIAAKYNVTRPVIGGIINNKTYTK